MVESGGEDHQKKLPPTPGKSMCSREAFPTADTLWGASYVTLARVTLSKQEAEIRDGSEKEPGENGKWGSSSLMGPSLSGNHEGGMVDPVWQGPSCLLCSFPLKQRCQGKPQAGRAACREAMSRDQEL